MRAVAILAVLALAACSSKDGNGKPAPADPGEAASARGGDESAGDPEQPKVAIGANRVEHFEVAPGAKKVAETKEFTLSVSVPDIVAEGESGEVTVDVVPQKGWKLNDEFPPRLKISPPEGVEVAKPNQNKADAVTYGDKGARWAVAFKAGSPGDKSFTGSIKFAVCTETTCNPRTQELAFAVKVE